MPFSAEGCFLTCQIRFQMWRGPECLPEVPGLKLGTLIEGDDGVVVFLRLEEFEVEARLVGATGDADNLRDEPAQSIARIKV